MCGENEQRNTLKFKCDLTAAERTMGISNITFTPQELSSKSYSQGQYINNRDHILYNVARFTSPVKK